MTRYLSLPLLVLMVGLAWLSLGWSGQFGEARQQPRRSVKVITINDNGQEITVRQGDLFRIELEAPGATGYLWQVEDLDASRLELINQSTRVPLSDGKMGGPVVSVFTFRAISEGSLTLTIDYYRPWEGRTKAEKTFTLTVNIP